LFRAYALHPGSTPRDALIVCNPLGEEAKSSFSVLQRFSRELWKRGYCVARFDYLGTGDSEGDFKNTRPQDWINDSWSVIEDFHSMTPLRSLVLMGLRLGANIAAHTACALPDNLRPAALVLWEPILNTARYIRHLTWISRNPRHGGEVDCFGWPMTQSCLEEIETALPMERSHIEGASFVANVSTRARLSRDFEKLRPLRHPKSCVAHVRSRSFWELVGESSCDPLIAETLGWLAHLGLGCEEPG
jgi:alpha-beta hydrolase superfamily lysophospholipase